MRIFSILSIFALTISGYAGLTSFTTVSSISQPAASGYDAQFISSVPSGSNFEWTWSVTNPNPGNGRNGTLQDLSHWSVVVPEWVNLDNIVAVEYSLDNVNWMPLGVNLGVDPSQSCYEGRVVKFDTGTSGTTTTYYRLTVDQEYSSDLTTAVFKSGKFTGCSTTMVTGIGKPVGDGPIRKG